MSSLFGTISIAVGALQAEQAALDTTANNIANVNTPGFSRQRPILAEGDPVTLGAFTIGSGVTLQKVESLRDSILQLRIQDETQQQGQLDAFVSAMQQVEVMFSGGGNDIGAAFSKYFSSLSQLSTSPADSSLRQAVLTAAGNLASTFRTTSQNLTSQSQNLDLDVVQTVQQINVLTSQIAGLNLQITNLENVHQDASAFIDQRDVLVEQLSSLVDVSSIRSDSSGLTLTTLNGTALVAGADAFKLSTQADASGLQHIYSQGSDITAKLSSGKLAGLLEVRDQNIPNLLSQLDSLAAGFATTVNTVHRAGFDLSGAAGGDLFVAPPATGIGAAASMAVAIADPSLLAASSDGSPGSNGNAIALSAVHDQPVAGGQTVTNFYANLVFSVGSDVANASSELDASQLIVRQLEDQRGSISGVSLDEEAANLIRYQRAYEAAARVVSTVNDILDTTINLGRY